MKDITQRLFRRYRVWYYTLRPTYALMFGYTVYTLAIFLLLCLPFCRKTAQEVPLIDSLFTAVAAISTTGLQTVNFTETYNILGQFILLLGIQIGGLGYMTLGSLVILASKGYLPKNRLKLGKAVLAMPESFDPHRFFRHIAVFTLSIELIGTLILWYCFWSAGTPYPLWAAIFHSVSAFCTAGISIFPNNLESFADNTAVSLTIALLSLLGGIGFIVMDDLYRSYRDRRFRTTLTTRIILTATLGAVFAGTLFLFFDPNLASFPLQKRLLAAFFQATSALTTSGFNTIPISNLASASMIIIVILMIMGASPSGTGGGLKSTTWSAALAAIMSFLRGDEEVTFFRSKVPHGRIIAAFASITLYMMTFSIGAYCLLLVDSHHRFETIVVEVAAALGTAGLSHGITAELSSTGKIIIMLLMYIGRLGVVSLALGAVALYYDISRDSDDDSDDPESVIKESDIIL
jgi:trk system potassium uptake protein TrkH